MNIKCTHCNITNSYKEGAKEIKCIRCKETIQIIESSVPKNFNWIWFIFAILMAIVSFFGNHYDNFGLKLIGMTGMIVFGYTFIFKEVKKQ